MRKASVALSGRLLTEVIKTADDDETVDKLLHLFDDVDRFQVT